MTGLLASAGAARQQRDLATGPPTSAPSLVGRPWAWGAELFYACAALALAHRSIGSALALLSTGVTTEVLRFGWRSATVVRGVAVCLGLVSAGIWLVHAMDQRLRQRAAPTLFQWWLLGACFVALRLVLTPEERLQGEEVLVLAVLVLPPVLKAASQTWGAVRVRGGGGLKTVLPRLGLTALWLWLLAFGLTCVGRFALWHQDDVRLALWVRALRGFGEIAYLSMHGSIALYVIWVACSKVPRRLSVAVASSATAAASVTAFWRPSRDVLESGLVAWGIGVVTLPLWLIVALLALGATTIAAVVLRPEATPRVHALHLSQWALLLAAGAMPLNGTSVVYLMLASAPAVLQHRARKHGEDPSETDV